MRTVDSTRAPDRWRRRTVGARDGARAMGVIVTLGARLSSSRRVETDIAATPTRPSRRWRWPRRRRRWRPPSCRGWRPGTMCSRARSPPAFFDGGHGRRPAGGAAIDLDVETAWLRCGAAVVRRPVAGRDDGGTSLGEQQPEVDGVCVGHGGDPAGRRRAGAARLRRGLGRGRPGGKRRRPLRDGGTPVAEAGSLDQPRRWMRSPCAPSPGAPGAAAASWNRGGAGRPEAPRRDCACGSWREVRGAAAARLQFRPPEAETGERCVS